MPNIEWFQLPLTHIPSFHQGEPGAGSSGSVELDLPKKIFFFMGHQSLICLSHWSLLESQ